LNCAPSYGPPKKTRFVTGSHSLKSTSGHAISQLSGNLFRDAASNVSSCSTWQLTKLIHRFDAQASWQGNRWIISFLSLRSTPPHNIARFECILLLPQGARHIRASRPYPRIRSHLFPDSGDDGDSRRFFWLGAWSASPFISCRCAPAAIDHRPPRDYFCTCGSRLNACFSLVTLLPLPALQD